MQNSAVILFTKIPLAGKVKTRLQPFLSGEECASLQEAFIRDTLDVLKKVCADIVLCYAPENCFNRLNLIIGETAVCIPQRGCGLGNKMYNAVSDVLNMGYDCCVLIGSDIPLLNKNDIELAIDILSSKDIAISPTYDGGYYLIGMKQPCASVFHMDYGHGTVFESTCAAIKYAGKTYGIGPSALDIDDKYDLHRLIEILEETALEQCVHTRKVLKLIQPGRTKA